MNSGVSLGSLLVGGVAGFLLGVVFAVTRQWFRDLADTKAKVVRIRKGAWSSTWALIKTGTVVLLLLALFGWWVYRDVTDHRPTPLLPSSTPHGPSGRTP